MSYLYQQYPQYPQPPAGAQPPVGSGIIPPPQGDPVPAGATYVPVDSNATWAEVHSQALTNIAAGNSSPQFAVLIPPAASGSAQYPFLMYKQDGTTKGAKDEKEKGELAAKGYTENPPQPDPNAVTPQMLETLQAVWTKAGEELKRLTVLVEAQQRQMQAAGNVLGAGQQQPPLFQQQQYPTSGYPQATGD